MMDNPPAFPVTMLVNRSSDPLATPKEVRFPGMTLRDWFAGQALCGMGNWWPCDNEGYAIYGPQGMKLKAVEAYRLADAMLATRGGTDAA